MTINKEVFAKKLYFYIIIYELWKKDFIKIWHVDHKRENTMSISSASVFIMRLGGK